MKLIYCFIGDTKIWIFIMRDTDHIILQPDIDVPNDWGLVQPQKVMSSRKTSTSRILFGNTRTGVMNGMVLDGSLSITY